MIFQVTGLFWRPSRTTKNMIKVYGHVCVGAEVYFNITQQTSAK